MIHFWIDESVAHSQIPKLWGSVSEFTKLWTCRKKTVGVQEETTKKNSRTPSFLKRLVLPTPPRFFSCTLTISNIPTLTLSKNLKRATFSTSTLTAHLHPWVSSVVEVLHNCWKQGGGVHNVAEVLSGL